VNDFLGNLRTFQEASDIEGPAWERFILKLIEVFGATVAPAQIYARFAASDELAALLPPELAGKLSGTDDHKAKSQFAQRIGYLFRDRVGKRFGDSQACIVRQRRTSDGNVWELKSGD
jgi:putative hemolysin